MADKSFFLLSLGIFIHICLDRWHLQTVLYQPGQMVNVSLQLHRKGLSVRKWFWRLRCDWKMEAEQGGHTHPLASCDIDFANGTGFGLLRRRRGRPRVLAKSIHFADNDAVRRWMAHRCDTSRGAFFIQLSTEMDDNTIFLCVDVAGVHMLRWTLSRTLQSVMHLMQAITSRK